MKHMMKSKPNKRFVRPESMQDEPDSNSCDSTTSDDNVVSEASRALGEGATLYLQTMKTFIIMFTVLVFFNLPIYILYENNTNGNDLLGLNNFFKYFTIGNLGQMTSKCGWADFDYKFGKQLDYHQDQQVSVSCGAGYIGELKEFGFLYTVDKAYGGKSEGQATCDHIENPTASYKKPALVQYNCSIEEDETEKEICELNKAAQDGDITRLEAED